MRDSPDGLPVSNSRRQEAVEEQKMELAKSISPRGARHFGHDHELAKNFREWDEPTTTNQ